MSRSDVILIGGTMQYWFIEFEEDQFWIEVDVDGTVLRQIISSQTGKVQVSCFEDCLAEGSFKPHEMDGDISEIANVLFEKQWESQIIGHFFIVIPKDILLTLIMH